MRAAMLSREDLVAAVLIGGMEGVEAELALFEQFRPSGAVVPVASPGGAARDIVVRSSGGQRVDLDDVDFARLFHQTLGREMASDRQAGDASRGV